MDDLLLNFIRLLVRRGRLMLLLDCLAEYHKLHLAEQGIAEGSVTTAVELGDEDRQALEAVLNEYTGKKLQVAYRVQPDLIGGVNFRSGELMIDNTLESALVRLGRKLRSARVY